MLYESVYWASDIKKYTIVFDFLLLVQSIPLLYDVSQFAFMDFETITTLKQRNSGSG